MVPCRITGEGEAKGDGLRVVFGDGARAMEIPVSLLPPVEEGWGEDEGEGEGHEGMDAALASTS